MMSVYVGKPTNIAAIEDALASDGFIFMVTQRNMETEDPKTSDLYQVGVVAHVIRSLKLPDGRCKVLLQGLARAKVTRFKKGPRYLIADIHPIEEQTIRKLSARDQAVMNRIRENLQLLVQYEHLPEEMLLVTEEVHDPGMLADVVVAHYKIDLGFAQRLLEEPDPLKRLKATETLLADDLNQFLLSEKIREKARDEMSKGQREYYLREQAKQIQRELGEYEESADDLQQLKEKLEQAELPKEPRAEAFKQFRRLERMSPEANESALLRTYLDWMSDLPWSRSTKDALDLRKAKAILDEDHFGLEKVKDRILEYLSVRKLNPSSRGPILCFLGPPGVGKTSLGKSIARALGRNFARISLGGVRDEAEIRGHRRTYIGALPGRIIQGLKQADSKNPVFMLDELDKVGADFRGDPSAALLEVLDPHQNKEFHDHYLNVPFDLSEVLFVATTNTVDTIPEALLDRLEVIPIPGYTTYEKVKIAQNYLIPRQMKENGLKRSQAVFPADSILFVVERYTREAGVRSLERELGSLCRKIARSIAESGRPKPLVTQDRIVTMLGPTRFDPELNEQKEDMGLVRGLAWTIHGGEVMPVEASIADGKGEVHLTGQLGSVMQESAQAALFYARAHAKQLGLDPKFHEKYDLHLHVPGGATPKDGPSAGITIATAIVSVFSGRKVARDLAMTGEITLRGNVLAVGGLREKALAALRYGITKVIIPYENLKDLEDIPEDQRKKIRFIPVKHVSEVLEMALRPVGKGEGTVVKRRPTGLRGRRTALSQGR
jgi:ATP-dependent Lon protease